MDQGSRRRFALALRRFASGRITRSQLDTIVLELEDSSDPGIAALADEVYWAFLNYGPKRLVGRHSLTRERRRSVARMVLFLRSSEPYQWPSNPRWKFLKAMVRLITLGAFGRDPDWRTAGDSTVYPFISRDQMARVTRSHPFTSRETSGT